MMRKSFAMLLALHLLVFSYGCATKDYVKQQMDPSWTGSANWRQVSRVERCCAKADAAAAKQRLRQRLRKLSKGCGGCGKEGQVGLKRPQSLRVTPGKVADYSGLIQRPIPEGMGLSILLTRFIYHFFVSKEYQSPARQ